MKNKIKNIMIKLKTLFFLLLFSVVTFAQENYTQRIIFLWDVTYSMHGGYCGGKYAPSVQVVIAGQPQMIDRYAEKYDIYTEAMDMLVSYLDSYNDKNTELVVIPFGSKVIDGAWRVPATFEGKASLIDKIKNFCELSHSLVGKTNISAAEMEKEREKLRQEHEYIAIVEFICGMLDLDNSEKKYAVLLREELEHNMAIYGEE